MKAMKTCSAVLALCHNCRALAEEEENKKMIFIICCWNFCKRPIFVHFNFLFNQSLTRWPFCELLLIDRIKCFECVQNITCTKWVIWLNNFVHSDNFFQKYKNERMQKVMWKKIKQMNQSWGTKPYGIVSKLMMRACVTGKLWA